MPEVSSPPYPAPVLPNEHTIKPDSDAASEEDAVFAEGGLAKKTSNTTLDVPIAEERSQDTADSNFWTTYKKVSDEYDNDFLERANDDMGVILTFAGLLSAVNSSFIGGMQPNPGDNTNVLLLKLIQITANPNSVYDISNLSSSEGYPLLTVCMQTFAYTSLVFSVLAASGAVLGKQWLNSYKAARGRGSLEERCIQRQMKLDGLEQFHLRSLLQAFLVFLQIALLLFSISLCIKTWTQQVTISAFTIFGTASGIVFYLWTTVVSVRFPQSPFWTPGSKPAGAIGKIFTGSTSPPGPSDKSSAIRWIIETSTNPEYVEAAAAMVPLAQWARDLDASAVYKRLRDNFGACCQKEALYVKYGKAMAHLCSQSVKIDPILLRKYGWDCWGGRSRFVRDAFMAGRDAYRRMTQEGNASHGANVRTALRTMAVHGLDHTLSLPDSEELIWNGDLRWRHSSNGDKPRLEEFDWLVDYLADKAKGDHETEGDTLLALSAMHGLWSSAKQPSFINALIRCMGNDKPPRVRHAALRLVSDTRGELAAITDDSMPQGVDEQLLDSLSRALLTAVCPNRQTDHYNASDTPFHEERDRRYINLIFSLAKNGGWRQRLIHDGHLQRCIDLVDKVSITNPSESYLPGFYLPAIIGRINPICKDTTLSATQKKSLRQLVEKTWRAHIYRNDDDYIDAIPALVTATKLTFQQEMWLATEARGALEYIQEQQATLVSNGVAQTTVDAALSSLEDFHEKLQSARRLDLGNT